MKSMHEPQPKNKVQAAGWIKRFGAAGFLFFLIKGLLWLFVIPVLATYFAC